MRTLLTSLLLLTASPALAQGEIVVYSPFADEFMQALAAPFTQETGAQVLNVVISTGESQSRLRAEAQNPQADLWLSVRPAILEESFEEGLIAEYEPAGAETIQSAYRYEPPYITAVGTYPLVFFYNTQALERSGLEAPTGSWDELVSDAYADQVVMPHPATSGTAYSAIATVLQIALQNGDDEEAGWQYVSTLNRSVAQFTRSGRAPQTLVAQGEYPVGIGFYDAVWQLQREGFPVEVVLPDPVFAEPYGAAVVAGGPNPEGAQAFFDYLLTPTAQEVLAQFGNYPVVEGIAPPEGGIEVPDAQVIEVDYQWSAENRERILERFQEVTQADPQD